jgi:hypothetical protein
MGVKRTEGGLSLMFILPQTRIRRGSGLGYQSRKLLFSG